MAQRESILQWDAEYGDPSHLRACDILKGSQHDFETPIRQLPTDKSDIARAELRCLKTLHVDTSEELLKQTPQRAGAAKIRQAAVAAKIQAGFEGESAENTQACPGDSNVHAQELREPPKLVPAEGNSVESYARRYKKGKDSVKSKTRDGKANSNLN